MTTNTCNVQQDLSPQQSQVWEYCYTLHGIFNMYKEFCDLMQRRRWELWWVFWALSHTYFGHAGRVAESTTSTGIGFTLLLQILQHLPLDFPLHSHCWSVWTCTSSSRRIVYQMIASHDQLASCMTWSRPLHTNSSQCKQQSFAHSLHLLHIVVPTLMLQQTGGRCSGCCCCCYTSCNLHCRRRVRRFIPCSLQKNFNTWAPGTLILLHWEFFGTSAGLHVFVCCEICTTQMLTSRGLQNSHNRCCTTYWPSWWYSHL